MTISTGGVLGVKFKGFSTSPELEVEVGPSFSYSKTSSVSYSDSSNVIFGPYDVPAGYYAQILTRQSAFSISNDFESELGSATYRSVVTKVKLILYPNP